MKIVIYKREISILSKKNGGMKECIQKKLEKQSGITLIALVVTIVVLLILAGVTINLLFSDTGLFGKAQEAKNTWENAENSDREAIGDLVNQANEILNGTWTGGTTPGEDDPVVEELPKVEDNLGTVISSTENTDLTDSLGNKITVPAGFFIVTSEQDDTVIYDYFTDGTPTVQDGIVIQNQADGNQFVWVPVGTINNKEGDTLGATTTIQLGRYSNFTMSGTTLPTPAQVATSSSANTAVKIRTYYFEVSDTFTGDTNQSLNAASSYGNTKATNLQEWINTTLTNGGYYIARYEASQNTTETTKAASVKNVQPWVSITQPNAAIVAKATYPSTGENNSSNYYSDLINSYAWDTAIVFIQAYENSSYADENYSKQETITGGNKDQVCNINDMSGNKWEWTTETSISSDTGGFKPCTRCGGCYYSSSGLTIGKTSFRGVRAVNGNDTLPDPSFRLLIYVK